MDLNLEQATEAQKNAKDALKAAKADLKAFRKENKIKPGEEPTDEKLTKKFNKLVKAVEEAESELVKADTAIKELTPPKGRATTYTYPEDVVTAADKKKYRAKMRRDAKKAKAEGEPAAEVKESPEPSKKKKEKKTQEED